MAGTTAILFPGQGAQSVGMGRALADALPAARETFEQADSVLGYGLSELCFEGPEDALTRTNNAQAAIYVTSVAAVRGLEAAGRFERDRVAGAAGLSLGEYTALWFAGALEFTAGLKLVKLRGEAMQAASETTPSGMVSLIGADRERAEILCDRAREDGILVVANLNAPGQVVISGDSEACGRAAQAAREAGIRRALPLKVAGAFHSPVMEPARKQLEDALAATEIRDAALPVWCNVTAEAVQDAGKIRTNLARQVVAPVLWADSMRSMIAAGVVAFIEPPPGRVLAGLMKKIDDACPVRALEADLEG